MGNWQELVSMLLLNRSKGWANTILAVGDRLMAMGQVDNAHMWYV